MNRVCLGLLRRVEDLVDNQIAFARRRWPDRICLIRHTHVKRAAVGVLSDSLKQGHFSALSSLAQLIGIDAARQHLTTALLIAPAALTVSTTLFFIGAKLQKKQDAR